MTAQRDNVTVGVRLSGQAEPAGVDQWTELRYQQLLRLAEEET